MKFLAPLLTFFALLTQPNGNTVRLAKSQIVGVVHAAPNECFGDSQAVVTMSTGARFCVIEPPEKAAAEIEKP